MGWVDIAGRCGYVPFMQINWHRLMSPTLSHRRLLYRVCRKCLNPFMFQCIAAKDATKWMAKLPNIVCGLVGISAYARIASEGGTYHPVCVWLTSGVPGH